MALLLKPNDLQKLKEAFYLADDTAPKIKLASKEVLEALQFLEENFKEQYPSKTNTADLSAADLTLSTSDKITLEDDIDCSLSKVETSYTADTNSGTRRPETEQLISLSQPDPLTEEEVRHENIQSLWQLYVYYQLRENKKKLKIVINKLQEALIEEYPENTALKKQFKTASTWGRFVPFIKTINQRLEYVLNTSRFQEPNWYPTYEDFLLSDTKRILLNLINQGYKKGNPSAISIGSKAYQALIKHKHFNTLTPEELDFLQQQGGVPVETIELKRINNIKIISLRQLLFFKQQAGNIDAVRELENILLEELKNIKIISLRELIFFKQQAGDLNAVEALENILSLEKLNKSNQPSLFNKIFFNSLATIDRGLKTLRIERPQYADNRYLDNVSETILEVLKFKNEIVNCPDSHLINQDINNIVDSLGKNKNLNKVDIKKIRNEKLKDIVSHFEQTEKQQKLTKVIISTLWQQLQVCQDKTIEAKITEELASILGISHRQILKARYLGWLPYIDTKKELLYRYIVANELDSPQYNANTSIIYATKAKLMQLYTQYMRQLSQNKGKVEEKTTTVAIRKFLYHLSTDHDIKIFDAVPGVTNAFNLLVDGFNRNVKNNDVNLYRRTRYTILALLNAPYSSAIPFFKGKDFDPKLYEVLLFLKGLYKDEDAEAKDGHAGLKKIFQDYFARKTVENPNEILDRFADFVLKRFKAADEADFSKLQLNSLRVMLTKRYYKKAINRWLEASNINYALRMISQHRRVYNSCKHLLGLLSKEKDHPLFKEKIAELDAAFQACQQIENGKDLNRLKLIRKHVVTLLEEAMIPYTDHVPMYERIKRESLTQEKIKRRAKKKFWDKIALAATIILALGQTFIGIYALLGLAPILGLPLAIILAALCCTGTFYACIILFRASTIQTLRQFFVDKDWFNGYPSLEGKFFMITIAAACCFAAGTMAMIVSISMVTALATFPIAAIIPLVTILAVTTFVGFTSLFYKSLAEVVTKTCNWLEKKVPEIVSEGWGFKGLCKGLWEGGRRLHRGILRPGLYTEQGGYKEYIKYKVQRLAEYLKNPTGNSEATPHEILYKQTQIVVRSIMIPLMFLAYLGLTIFATVATLQAWNAELFEFLVHNPILPIVNLPVGVATWVSFGVVCVMTGAVQGLFNLETMANLFTKLNDFICNKVIAPLAQGVISGAMTICEKLGLKKARPCVAKPSIQVEEKSFSQKIKSFAARIKNDPQGTVFKWLKKFKIYFFDNSGIWLDSLNEVSIVLKGALLLANGQPNPQGVGWVEGMDSVSSFAACFSMTNAEFKRIRQDTPLSLPLAAYEALVTKTPDTKSSSVTPAERESGFPEENIIITKQGSTTQSTGDYPFWESGSSEEDIIEHIYSEEVMVSPNPALITVK